MQNRLNPEANKQKTIKKGTKHENKWIKMAYEMIITNTTLWILPEWTTCQKKEKLDIWNT